MSLYSYSSASNHRPASNFFPTQPTQASRRTSNLGSRLFVTPAITLVLFLVVETLTPETAMAPTRVVLNRTVGSCMLFMLLLSGGMMAAIYYLTIWFQAAQGQSAINAGIRTIPLVPSLTIFSILAAIFTQKVSYYVRPCCCPLFSAPLVAACFRPSHRARTQATGWATSCFMAWE